MPTGNESNSRNINPHNPISHVRYIPLDKVFANNYNPNSVALMEMKLLYVSIKNDGYTQPVVTIYDPKNDRYVIVDGFHRYSIMKMYKDIYELNGGLLPCVVLENKTIDELMASTIRHNRARGKHSVVGMSSLIMSMVANGVPDEEICKNLGLEAEELLRLKHITGYSKLYAGKEYSKARYSEIQAREANKKGEENGNSDDADSGDKAV